MLQIESIKPNRRNESGSPPKLSGDVFGALINLSGRRRFTSQRVVLYALLASLGHDGALATAREALNLFRDAHLTLIKGKDDLPGVFCDDLEQAYFGNLQGDRHIRGFIDLADRVFHAIEREARQTPVLLDELVRNATPLLTILNSLTKIYEEQSKHHAVKLQKQLRSMMTDIKTIAKQARMVSFNAQIVAARAGVAGREFSVVAGVLTNITGEIDELVHEALAGSIA